MKNIFATLALIAPLAALSADLVYVNPTGTITRAEVQKPGGTNDTGALRVGTKVFELYDSGSVAAGAVIDTGVIDTSGATIATVYVTKGDATSRVPTFTFYRADGTTVQATWAPSACAATSCFYNVGITAAGGTASQALVLPPKLKVVLASGGAVAARVIVDIR